jgi:ATP-binding cassette subfamily B protein
LFEDFMQYQATVGENIGYGQVARLDDDARIAAAAAQAGVDGFIAELPAQYHTMLGQWFEGAQDLSKGQWQLVALARAFFRNAPIVILDEPTASLSPSKEQEVFGALRAGLRADQIGILVSHRFSTVRLADVIIVVEGGQITERGTHESLMQAGGTYARLYAVQASAYADVNTQA